MGRITRVLARELLDSRGVPTVEVEMQAAGNLVRAIVPSGASTGTAEALELRDHESPWYDGRGVGQAVRNVNEQLGPAVVGLDPSDQWAIDRRLLELDDSPRKARLGGNAVLGVSLAAAHLGAAERGVPLFQHFFDLSASLSAGGFLPAASPALLPALSTAPPFAQAPAAPRMPLPMTNMISGGLHAGGNIDFQDVLVMPIGAGGYRRGLEWIVRIYRRLGDLLTRAGYEGRLVGDEGGYGPRLKSNHEAVEFVVRAIEAAGLRPGEDVTIALDVASTHFFDGQAYRLKTENDRLLSSGEMIDRLEDWVARFPITSIEDGLAEDDWDGWRELTRRLGARVRLVGDDLFATNVERLVRGVASQTANSVLIKVNQIGTLAETFATMHAARAAGYTRVVSARSGETEDATIADLAVGSAAELIKIGSIVRSERLSKYNQLLRIAEQLEESGL